MTRDGFEHAIRAAGAVLGVDEVLVIGSQAVHASLDEPLPWLIWAPRLAQDAKTGFNMLSYRPFKSVHDLLVQALLPHFRRRPSDCGRNSGHQLSYTLHDRIGIEATSLRQATPMARANLPDVVLTIHSHSELRPAVRDPVRVW